MIFILITCVQLREFSILTISFLTAMDVVVYKISIPDAGGSQPFIRESSGGDTPALSHEK
ncbi:MAG TPA: hypothetical protein ACFYD4_15215 [Candidatus Wunengus sp. YC61]|uniref:hypothetical protein n=1 Tax=Candidatus Wunengus sp. YC61 TaxID=3367698 RepID=UPI002721E57F|nr:hypothetical protein [Candidatus Methanoperedens sp.]